MGIYTLIISYYAPNQGQVPFFSSMFEGLISQVKGVVLFGGDSNLALDLGLDKSRPSTFHFKWPPKMSLCLTKLLHSLVLVDVWRETHSTGRDYTDYSAPHATYARIDHIFISSSCILLVQDAYQGDSLI